MGRIQDQAANRFNGWNADVASYESATTYRSTLLVPAGKRIGDLSHTRRNIVPRNHLIMSFAVCSAVSAAAAMPMSGENLGAVHFQISCTKEQAKFDRAVSLLHNFFYPETVKAFQAIIDEDPNCAIAYWGLAMSERPNPLVPPFPAANLKAGWDAVQQGRKAKVRTPREADYLAAIATFYGGYDSIDQHTRTRRYEAAMKRLHEHYPNDPEAAIFYALALNEAVDLNDRSFARQRKAAAILHVVARKQPNHPGISHYLIHSYDFTSLARKGLPSAQLYSNIAASSPHALHMPSHVYSMLGMWEASIHANRAAEAAANDYAAKNLPGTTNPSLPHLLDFLEFAYLQLAQDREAKLIVDELPRLKKFAYVGLGVDTALAAIPARYALERGRWDEAALLPVRDSQYPAAQSISYFARALGAARSNNPAAAREEITHLQDIEKKLIAAKDDYWAGQTRVQVTTARAWVLFDEGRRVQAIALLRKAAELDDVSQKNVAMENKLVPVRALLGELYLQAGMPRAALHEFQSSLKASPNRYRSFAEAMTAARQSNSMLLARQYAGSLVRLAAAGDGKRAEVVMARAFLAQDKVSSLTPEP